MPTRHSPSSCRARSRLRKPHFEPLEARQMLSLTVFSYYDRQARDDGFAVAQDGQAIVLDVTHNDSLYGYTAGFRYYGGLAHGADEEEADAQISELRIDVEPEHGTVAVDS